MVQRRRGWVQLPSTRVRPVVAVLIRLAIPVAVLLVVIVIVYAERDGYQDGTNGGELSLLDSAYYATVTLTTTGYGDIVPASSQARLVNTVVITPMRLIFLIALVGTTLQVLAERTRQDIRLSRWRSRVRDHTIVVGYGTKGRNAVRALLRGGVPIDRIVVVDPTPASIAEANEAGLTGVIGDATRSQVLRRAEVTEARQVVVGVARDDTAVLVTLTARQLNPSATVIAGVRESENEPLLRQSGADHVVTSSETAGRLLGTATLHPKVGEVFHDLLTRGKGLDMTERPVRASEVGVARRDLDDLVLAVVRGGQPLAYDDPRCVWLEAGDRLIIVRSQHAADNGTTNPPTA